MALRRMQMAAVRPATGRTPRSFPSEVRREPPTASPSSPEQPDELSRCVSEQNAWCDRVDSILRRAGF